MIPAAEGKVSAQFAPPLGPSAETQPTQPGDGELLAQIASGNFGSFDVFLRRYQNRVIGYLHHRNRGAPRDWAAEDLAQETFLRVFRAARAGGYSGAASAATWVFTVANNVLSDHRRQSKRRPLKLQSDLPDGPSHWNQAAATDGGPVQIAQRHESEERVAALLKQLPEAQAQVVALKVIGELRFTEIAEVLGCPVTTVQSRMAYGLKKLQAILEQERLG